MVYGYPNPSIKKPKPEMVVLKTQRYKVADFRLRVILDDRHAHAEYGQDTTVQEV